MTPISEDTIRASIAIIGTTGIVDEQIERAVRALVADDITARRLIDWIPEVFGIVMVSAISNKIILPRNFSVKSTSGEWVEVPFETEPIFITTYQIAQTMFHDGPREVFQNVSLRSSMANTVNHALNSGVSLDGASMSGPVMIGIPADLYAIPSKPFWRRLFGG